VQGINNDLEKALIHAFLAEKDLVEREKIDERLSRLRAGRL
jgi:hypothetical protein